ncbi:hypothetical protein H8356DRAFT_974469 [Neocallimastix lanati (nom. inval.)]|jgi:hypothetical protein|uniref:Dickkopf N-terminal cysteine-rich domain-containing protein n=1 Tax=Neocallimastix californiae TaxID=1754190 RepID=A0A1Y2F4A8_9FUNG|nr:hypothetical protein H8356DRAFT_974469 [Neocallimastix sp. JGI-2020a]ORY78702.1 hypothetical protein LY90DRAFT_500889 [Neocallimastix californiae]|eukprot:ORY78702.1 hypothetical protein LY90DRAFT_500889 [Neocallimastix californiae]
MLRKTIFNRLIIFLSVLFLTRSQDLNLAILTNYTRQDLLQIKREYKCSNSSECPFGSYCHPDNYCIFEFICPDAENEYCMSLNITMWRANDEVVVDEYSKKMYRPILKTCSYNNIGKNGFSKIFASCYTEKCTENNECYSGICEYETCILGYKTNYRCGNQEDIASGIKCALNNQMPCSNNSECYSKYCNKGVCKKKEFINHNFTYEIFIIIVILVAILVTYRFIKSKKQEEKLSKYMRMM